jgi:cardiolipin synthase
MFRDDRTGSALAAELAAAVKRGVKVFLIYDYIGSVDTPSSFFKKMALDGIKVIPFNVPSFRRGIRWFDRRDHRKMVIVDAGSAFLGGFNIGDEYAGIAPRPNIFRDIGFCVSGSAVEELITIFCEAWQMERESFPELPVHPTGPLKQGKADVIIVSGGPHQRSSYIRGAFLVNIASASEELLIANPYFVPGPRIIRALLRAAARGVRVKLLLPARSDVRLVLLVGRSSYAALLAGGVEIYELEEEILHAKVMLVDGDRAVIGSANLDQRSFHRNFEINCVVDDRSFSRQMRRVLGQEFNKARQIKLEEHERRGPVTRLLERIINLFSWFL